MSPCSRCPLEESTLLVEMSEEVRFIARFNQQ